MTTKARITVQGAPKKYDADELLKRQRGYHLMYSTTDQCCEMIYSELPYLFLTKIIDKHEQGYTLTSKYPISTDTLNYHAHMVKPANLQTLDLQAIDERVKAEYIIELEADLAKYKELLRLQLLEKAELAEQEKLDLKRAKLLKEVEQEVNDAFGTLIVPA
jgi:uncharacterized protein YqgQ